MRPLAVGRVATVTGLGIQSCWPENEPREFHAVGYCLARAWGREDFGPRGYG